MKKVIFALFVISVFNVAQNAHAQRMTQQLGRGVVAVNNGTAVNITWRKLAQEPEDVMYNVYVNGKKLNASPLKLTNMQTTTSKVASGSKITVTTVTESKEGTEGIESAQSEAFTFKTYTPRCIFVDIRYKGGPLTNSDYATKYIWPCDLDGDGEMDYVVDRNPLNGGTHKVEAYLRDGTYLWTVDMGPNESIGNGQDDQVVAWDFDCDGKGEVMIQSSDGTRFWDKENNTWGKYVFGKTTGDIDGDGIIDYETQSSKNPPRYFTVIDGMTGAEKASVEMTYNTYYNRTNKSTLMGDEYNKHVGKFGICYFDGVHPGVAMEWHTRTTDGSHHYYSEGFQYDYSGGKAGELKDIFQYGCGSGSFHSIRVGDVDFDGKDEMIEGGWTMDHTGKVLFNAGIAHGDRFRTTDINPEVPGLETFAIQQNAGDMLGQILYQAENGKALKKWYLSGVGDVGRGDCYDLDASRKGWEMFSTMNGYAIYDANGDATGQTGYFPTEALWWDGDLGREYEAASDGNGANMYVAKYGSGRLIEFAKENSWQVNGEYGARAAFWGDIIGDWREEVILKHLTNGVVDGFTGYSTDYATTEDRIYCLMEDPAYHGQMLCKGYYQTPMPFFYLGYDMPRPQLPPVMRADAENQVFDLTLGDAVIAPDAAMKNIYAMPVVKQTLTIKEFKGSSVQGFNLWKAQHGTLEVTTPITTTGKVYITEGTLKSTSTISAPVELRARGVLSGSPTLSGGITFEGALNYAEGILLPEGTMTFQGGLKIDQRLFIEYTNVTDLVKVEGDLNIATNDLTMTIAFSEREPGEYKLIEYTGTFTGDVSNLKARGMTGYAYSFVNKNGAIYLVIAKQRDPHSGVVWTGSESGVWDYQTSNFAINGEPTTFVAGDTIVFDDNATESTITLNELMPVGGVEFKNDGTSFVIQGEGGISGKGSVTFSGNGKVNMKTAKSNYTGKTTINAGTVTVSDLMDSGTACSLGAGTTLEIGKGTLVINNASTSTNKTITLTDTATIQIASGTSAMKGIIKGKGRLVKKGSGQLNFTYDGANTFTGGLELAAGTIAHGTWRSSFGSGQIDVTGNSTITVFNCNSTSTIPTLPNKINIAEGKTVTLNGGQRCSLKPTLLGKGTMKFNFPYVRGDFAPNCTNFEGVLEATSGEVRLAGTLNMPNATLKLTGDGYVYNNTGTHKIGALEGSNAAASITSGTWNIGYKGTDASYAGTYSVALNKYGEGKQTLTGAGTGAITVNEGTLDAENTSASITTGVITVKSGAILLGVGQVQNVTIQSGGTIGAGKGTMTAGTMTVNGTLTVQSGGQVRVRARGSSITASSYDHLKVAGATKLTSPVFVMERISGEWIEGEYQVFSGAGKITLSGDVTFEPAQPKDGYLWDTSKLVSDGIIAVVADPTGISGITGKSGEPGTSKVTGITGISGFTGAPGVYIIDGKKVLVK